MSSRRRTRNTTVEMEDELPLAKKARKKIVVSSSSESEEEIEEIDEDYNPEEAEVEEKSASASPASPPSASKELATALLDYFKQDPQQLNDVFSRELKADFDLDSEKLKTSLGRIIEELPQLMDDYGKPRPTDQLWKLNLAPNVVRRLEPVLISLRDTIEAEQPTLVKILGSHLPAVEKQKALEYFDTLQNTGLFTEDYYRIRDLIKDILKNAYSTATELESLQEREKALKDKVDTKPYLEKILSLPASTEVRSRIYEKYQVFKDLESSGRDYDTQKAWLDHALALPYDKGLDVIRPMSSDEVNLLCVKIKRNLDAKVFGLESVKQELLLSVVNRLTNSRGGNLTNLALCGPPGIGKSLIFSCIAEALGIPFECISLGGLTDPNLLKGHQSTYVGSDPGLIVQILKRMKTRRGMIFFDELDKLGTSDRGREVQYTLLHLIDITTNKDFRDNYLSDIPLDLSGMWFCFAMNYDNTIDKALRDRLHLMKLKMYSPAEKLQILQNYLLPQALLGVGMDKEDVKLTPEAGIKIVRFHSDSDGIRPLKDQVASLVSRINLYRSVLLSDGTVGDVKLDYQIPNFQLPLIVGEKLLRKLLPRAEEPSESFRQMFL